MGLYSPGRKELDGEVPRAVTGSKGCTPGPFFPTASWPGLWKPPQHWSFHHFLSRIHSSASLQWRTGPDGA